MTIPSFKNFDWLHGQPLFTRTRPKFELAPDVNDEYVQKQAARIVEDRARRLESLRIGPGG
jgi:hypothetical protein